MLAYRALLADARFRRFWLSLLLVMLADEFVRTTLMWHVYAETGSSEAVGLLMVCLTGPIIAGGLVAGWLLDHFPRARVMSADAGVRTASLLLAALVSALGIGGVLPLYAMAVVQGLLTMVLLAGAPSAIAELVAAPARSAANALEMLGFTAAAAIGPLLAGQIAAHAPAAVSLALAALCYAVFARVVLRLPIGGGHARAAAVPVRWRHSGVFHPTVAIITVMFVAFNIGAGAIAVFLPPLVDHTLARGAGTYGTLLAVMGIGGSLGALAAGSLAGTARLPAAVAAAQVLTGLVLLPLAWLAATGQPTLPVVIGCLFAFGLCSGPLTVWAQTIRMRFVAPQWRGRAFAALRMIMQSGRPIGGAAGGFAIAALPLAPCLLAASAVIGLPAALALAHPAMNRRLPDPPLRNTPA